MSRLRIGLFILMGLGAISASLFIMENEVRGLREDLDEIHRQTRADKDAIHVMQAEWAYLTQPERIALLVKDNMPQLAPQRSDQYYSIESATVALGRVHKETEAAALETDSKKAVQ